MRLYVLLKIITSKCRLQKTVLDMGVWVDQMHRALLGSDPGVQDQAEAV